MKIVESAPKEYLTPAILRSQTLVMMILLLRQTLMNIREAQKNMMKIPIYPGSTASNSESKRTG